MILLVIAICSVSAMALAEVNCETNIYGEYVCTDGAGHTFTQERTSTGYIWKDEYGHTYTQGQDSFGNIVIEGYNGYRLEGRRMRNGGATLWMDNEGTRIEMTIDATGDRIYTDQYGHRVRCHTDILGQTECQ